MNVDAIQNLEKAVKAKSTKHHGTLSLLLLHASWNKNVKLHTFSFESVLKDAISELNISSEHEKKAVVTESQLQYIKFQVDFNDDTLDFSIADQTKHACTYSSTDILMNRKSNIVPSSASINLQAPGELPALMLIYHQINQTDNEETMQTSRVSITPLDIINVVNRKEYKTSSLYAKNRKTLKEAILNALRDISIEYSSKKRKFVHSDGSLSSCEALSSHSKLNQDQIKIFIAGDRTQVGKSSVCLGILGTLVQKLGYPPSSLAYIKPATQCEETQLVTTFCNKYGIENCPVGPIVYYRGFTRAYLNGETQSSEQLLEKVEQAVQNIGRGKAIIIIDGVGYPSVGSITNTDNASVAIASGYDKWQNGKSIKVPCATLIVGKKGVGDAVDSYNMNANYFRMRNVPILGAIFNRLPADGYYSFDNCKVAISSYFRKRFDSGIYDSVSARMKEEKVFGFVPEVGDIADLQDKAHLQQKKEEKSHDLAIHHAKIFIEIFSRHVDVQEILRRAVLLRDNFEDIDRISKRTKVDFNLNASRTSPNAAKESYQGKIDASESSLKLSRMQIEETAKLQGAAGG